MEASNIASVKKPEALVLKHYCADLGQERQRSTNGALTLCLSHSDLSSI